MARRHSRKAIRNGPSGVAAAIQRCQVHKGRNIIGAPAPEHLHAERQEGACVRPGTRTTQTRPSGSCATWSGVWSMRNRASRARILEGLEEILTVIRLGLPHATPALARLHQHRRERARHGADRCTRNVKRWSTRRDGAADGPPPACLEAQKDLPSPQGLSPAAHPPTPLSRNTVRKAQSRQCVIEDHR